MRPNNWMGLLVLVAACDSSPSTSPPEQTAAQSCGPETVECGGACVSLRSHPEHCGACNSECTGYDVCEEGACVDPGPPLRWAVGFDSNSSSGVAGLAIDPAGNVAVAGWMGNRGNGTSALRREIMVASYSSDGAQWWLKRFGGSNFDEGRDVAVDAEGNLYAVGQFEQPATFGAKQLRPRGRDAFVASFGSNGNHRWSTAIGSEAADGASVVVVTDDVLVGGYFGPAASVGGAVFVGRYGRDGKEKWLQSYPASGDADVSGMAVAADGGLYIAGVFSKDATFGEQRLTASTPNRAGFLASLDSAGKVRWARAFESKDDLRTDRIALDEGGRIVLAGWSSGAIDFGGAQFECESSCAFVVGFEPDGQPSWAHALRERGSVPGEGVTTAIGPNGLVYLTGSLVLGATDEAPTDPVVVGLDAAGKIAAVMHLGELHQPTIQDLRIGSNGTIVMAGLFSGANFGRGTVVPIGGGSDGFVAGFGQITSK